MGWVYASRSIVLQNWETITREIYACPLWHQPGVIKVVSRMRSRMDGKGWGAGVLGQQGGCCIGYTCFRLGLIISRLK
jgi:hypothetical protein